MHHENNSSCEKCREILERYPNFDKKFRLWFEDFQKVSPEAHISCAGRGKIDQENAFKNGTSRARWTESAHNYGAALDFFCVLDDNKGDLYNKGWFFHVLKPALNSDLKWYGEPGSSYYELPHVELAAWRDMRDQGLLFLVE